MSEVAFPQVRAVLVELEGAAMPQAFLSETLVPYSRERIGSYLSAHWDDDEVDEAIEEAGRLFGGFTLKQPEADALLQRWIKQDRKATPLKVIQGLIWQEGYAAGALKSEIYPDVADALRAWSAAGARLFVYSSSSELAQKTILAAAPGGDLTPLFEGFLDTVTGQKIEPGSYTAICEQLGLPPAQVLLLSANEEELDAARGIGLATAFIARDGGAAGTHPTVADFAALRIG